MQRPTHKPVFLCVHGGEHQAEIALERTYGDGKIVVRPKGLSRHDDGPAHAVTGQTEGIRTASGIGDMAFANAGIRVGFDTLHHRIELPGAHQRPPQTQIFSLLFGAHEVIPEDDGFHALNPHQFCGSRARRGSDQDTPLAEPGRRHPAQAFPGGDNFGQVFAAAYLQGQAFGTDGGQRRGGAKQLGFPGGRHAPQLEALFLPDQTSPGTGIADTERNIDALDRAGRRRGQAEQVEIVVTMPGATKQAHGGGGRGGRLAPRHSRQQQSADQKYNPGYARNSHAENRPSAISPHPRHTQRQHASPSVHRCHRRYGRLRPYPDMRRNDKHRTGAEAPVRTRHI